jgi:hypothetical protein
MSAALRLNTMYEFILASFVVSAGVACGREAVRLKFPEGLFKAVVVMIDRRALQVLHPTTP